MPSVPARPKDNRQHFFKDVQHGPQAAPARDPVRELVVAMRKQNLSVYDIQAELAARDLNISINTLSVLLREEGFARLAHGGATTSDRPA